MGCKVSDQGPSLTLDDIHILEDTICSKLPNDYVKFLLSINGGKPNKDFINIPACVHSPTDVHILFGIKRELQSECLMWNIETLRERLHKYQLPIGIDSGGSCFVLNLSKEKSGSIWYIDLQSIFCNYNAVADSYYICNSFSKFLKLLYSRFITEQ